MSNYNWMEPRLILFFVFPFHRFSFLFLFVQTMRSMRPNILSNSKCIRSHSWRVRETREWCKQQLIIEMCFHFKLFVIEIPFYASPNFVVSPFAHTTALPLPLPLFLFLAVCVCSCVCDSYLFAHHICINISLFCTHWIPFVATFNSLDVNITQSLNQVIKYRFTPEIDTNAHTHLHTPRSTYGIRQKKKSETREWETVQWRHE